MYTTVVAVISLMHSYVRRSNSKSCRHRCKKGYTSRGHPLFGWWGRDDRVAKASFGCNRSGRGSSRPVHQTRLNFACGFAPVRASHRRTKAGFDVLDIALGLTESDVECRRDEDTDITLRYVRCRARTEEAPAVHNLCNTPAFVASRVR